MEKIYFDIGILVGKYLASDLTEEERTYLDEWIAVSERRQKWFLRVTNQECIIKKRADVQLVDVERGWGALQKKRATRCGRRLWIRWCRYAAVLMLPLIVCTIVYRHYNSTGERQQEVYGISAGVSRAFLVMDDGTTIPVEQRNMVFEEKDGTKIDLKEEHITYELTGECSEDSLIYNELVVPRGGEFSLTLSDGTVVFLNADSRLRYPVKFSDANRTVELKGEGYFHVMRNEKVPFVVRASGVDITVLGTEFNVSNYQENSAVQATLITGVVKVTREGHEDSRVLRPGEQAIFNKKNQEIAVKEVDVSYVVAWKEGRLRFRDRPLGEIMDFIARWYDVEVVYEDEEVRNYLFGCNFNRHETVYPLLELFQSTGTVRFEVVEKKIIVRK